MSSKRGSMVVSAVVVVAVRHRSGTGLGRRAAEVLMKRLQGDGVRVGDRKQQICDLPMESLRSYGPTGRTGRIPVVLDPGPPVVMASSVRQCTVLGTARQLRNVLHHRVVEP